MKKNTLVKITAALIFLTALVVTAASWVLSTSVIKPSFKCRPDHVYCGTPAELKIPYEEISFKTKEGIILKGWYLPGDGKRAVIFLHGHGVLKNEGLRYAKALHSAGIGYLLFDMRNQFNSGFLTSMGYHEQHDVMAAVSFLNDVKKIKKVGVFGISMGAATGILAMSADKRIGAGLFDSGFSSMREEAKDIVRRDYGLPAFPFVNLGLFFAEIRGGIDFDAANPVDKIGSISPRPLLIIHCDRDPYIEFKHAERLIAAAKEPKSIWAAPCEKHARVWNFNKEKTESITAEFFKKNL